MEQVLAGMTIGQYARYNTEAQAVHRKWEMSEGKKDFSAEMEQVLLKHNQNPALFYEDGKLNYHACGLIHEWHEAINSDAALLVRFSQLCGEVQQSMVLGGGGGDIAQNTKVDGVTLDQYAQICAKTQGYTEDQLKDFVSGFGIESLDRWKTVSAGFAKAMEEDGSKNPAEAKLVMVFGQLFSKYSPGHAAAMTQLSEDLVAQAMDDHKQREEFLLDLQKQVVAMTSSKSEPEILEFVRSSLAKDIEEDSDYLDYFLGNVCDLLVSAGNRSGTRKVLSILHEVRDEPEEKEEWIANEMDSLF